MSDASASCSGPSLLNPDELDMEIKAVIAGSDWTLTHRKLSFAAICLADIPGCEFIATNRDRLGPMPDGLKYPAAGATVGALEYVTNQPAAITIGKPGPALLNILFATHDINKKRAIMVGDRLDTDIAFGHKGQVDTLLVLTGVTSKELADSATGEHVANYGINSLAEIGLVLSNRQSTCFR